MNTKKIVENIIIECESEILKNKEYTDINSRIIEIHKKLKETLSSGEKKLLLELMDLETQSEIIALDFYSYKSFLLGCDVGKLGQKEDKLLCVV